MCVNKIIVCLFFMIFCGGKICNAQKDKGDFKPREYSMVLFAGGGLSYYVTHPGVPSYLKTEVSKYSPSFSLRLMWFPDHRLRFGVETGLLPLYKYTIKESGVEGDLKLSAVPIIAEWSMQFGKRLNVFAGTGSYFLTTKLNYAGETTSGNISLGWMLAVSYNLEVNENLFITPEIKWFDIAETQDQTINFQMMAVWKFFKW